ncbi:8899_t:CDS:1 [Cetraspora pellucida]|uniref:8899_t:CDS:1 n=1 Tax=Cetraspora pellucida TaxID=1433469 RepID=A0A9N8WH48_9GLOM|nr:8899_t:CDS:1 [Cetraspora pellucida]
MMNVPMMSISEIEQLNAEEIARNHIKDGKSMNSFFLYRREYTKREIGKGQKVRMIDISKHAAKAWKNEKPKYKRAYAKVSKKVDELLQRKRQKNQKYQIIYDDFMTKIQPISHYESVSIPEEGFFLPPPPALDHPSPSQDEIIYSLNVDDITLFYLTPMFPLPSNYFSPL